jgi:hypothetical protein
MLKPKTTTKLQRTTRFCGLPMFMADGLIRDCAHMPEKIVPPASITDESPYWRCSNPVCPAHKWQIGSLEDWDTEMEYQQQRMNAHIEVQRWMQTIHNYVVYMEEMTTRLLPDAVGTAVDKINAIRRGLPGSKPALVVRLKVEVENA